MASTSLSGHVLGESFMPPRTHLTVMYTEPWQYISKRNCSSWSKGLAVLSGKQVRIKLEDQFKIMLLQGVSVI